MGTKKVIKILKKVGAIKTDAFGNIVGVEINKLYKDPSATQTLSDELALKFSGVYIDTILAPENSAKIEHLIAQRLSEIKHSKVMGVAVKKEGGLFSINPSDLISIANKQILIVDDVFVTYKTIKKLVELVRNNKGSVVGICAVCDQSTEGFCETVPRQPRTVSLLRISRVPFETPEGC